MIKSLRFPVIAAKCISHFRNENSSKSHYKSDACHLRNSPFSIEMTWNEEENVRCIVFVQCAPQFWFDFLCGAHNYPQHKIRTRARETICHITVMWWQMWTNIVCVVLAVAAAAAAVTAHLCENVKMRQHYLCSVRHSNIYVSAASLM